MQEALKRIDANSHPRVGAVLHVGAGSCRELEDFLRLKAEKVMLLEANPGLADRLRKSTRELKHVQVINSAVAAAEGPNGVLRVLSNPRESTLMQPTRLLARLPNLRVAREVSVPVISLSGLISRLAPDPARHNLLVLETQGAELAVLSATAPEDLRAFTWIAVRTSAESLYEDGATAAEVDEVLRRSGFRPVIPPQPHSALPFQNLLYQIDAPRLYWELKDNEARLNQELAEARHELAELRQELAEARKIGLSLALREADLKDLQSRYSQSLAVQESQRETLSRIAERLKAASRYLHQMEPPAGVEGQPGTGPRRAAGKLTGRSGDGT